MRIIQHFLENSLRNFNYIVYSENSHDAIFFDPYDIDRTLPLAKNIGLQPRYLLKTHNHPDHIKDVDNFLSLPNTKHIKLKHDEVFELSEYEKIKCIDTPGHVIDHQCFLLMDHEEVTGIICGDTVF
jgi:glyoxylase-like metal-dependent hydrolase (beta-lactamase superfamily II)